MIIDYKLIIILGISTSLLVELLKQFNTEKNILALLSTIAGALITVAYVQSTTTRVEVIDNLVLGAMIGASSAGVYDIVKGIAKALNLIGIFSKLNGQGKEG